MKPGLSGFLLGVLIFIWFSYKIFPHTYDAFFYDTCSVEYANMRTEELFSLNEKSNEKARKAMAEADRFIAKLNIPPQDLLTAKKDFFRYGWFMNQKRCGMPKEVEEAFFKWTLDAQDKGTKDCPADFYEKESRAAYALLSIGKKELDKFERTVLAEIIENTQGNEKARDLIEKEWADPQFREKLILSGLQAAQRSEAGCRDENLPLKEMLREVMREYKP